MRLFMLSDKQITDLHTLLKVQNVFIYLSENFLRNFERRTEHIIIIIHLRIPLVF
jgi:hypothetical protein